MVPRSFEARRHHDAPSRLHEVPPQGDHVIAATSAKDIQGDGTVAVGDLASCLLSSSPY